MHGGAWMDFGDTRQAGPASLARIHGGEVGTLVVVMPATLVGAEIEVERVASGTPDGRHVAHGLVLNRPMNGTRVPTVVFPDLPEGEYELVRTPQRAHPHARSGRGRRRVPAELDGLSVQESADRSSTGLTSTIGVPSRASRSRTRIRRPSTETIRDAVQSDRIGTVGRARVEHALLGVSRIASRVHCQYVAAGAIEPGQHDDVRAGGQVANALTHGVVEDEPGLRRTLEALFRGGLTVNEWRLDPADRPDFVVRQRSSRSGHVGASSTQPGRRPRKSVRA